MLEHQNKVKAIGVVGEVYTTEISMDVADPYEQAYGWKQLSATIRVRVESVNLAVHDRFCGWRRVDKEGGG